MVRSIGIDPGDRVAHVVELDGSYRKTRLNGVHSASVGAGDDPLRPGIIAEAVREALDVEGMKGEVTFGHPCREAVLRTIELPFKGADAIKKVVKSEIEGEIYTHSVDDMIVDFHEIGEGQDGGTRLLVASVPKLGLRSQLESLHEQRIDPEHVDLDTMALWRAADWVGAFEASDDDGDDVAPVHAVVDLGARTVKVLLVEGDNLVDMRVLRLGDSAIADAVARHHDLLGEQASEAVQRVLQTGGDVSVDPIALPTAAEGDDAVAEVGIEPAADASPDLPAPAAVLVTAAEVEEAQTRFLQRLARELTRFLTATGMAARIRSVRTCGSACRLPGATEMLAAVFGVQPEELDVLANLAHDLDEAEATVLSPRLAVAVGLALGRMGGPEGFQLRQEDLALTGGFERIKFPLAIACMVALLTLFVFANQKSMELKKLELEIGEQWVDVKRPQAAFFHGLLNPLFASRWFEDKQYFAMKYRGRPYAFEQLFEEVREAPVHKRVRLIRDRLKEVAKQKQKESGVFEDVSLESGLAVLVRWAEILKGVEPQLGRYLVPVVDLDMKARKLEFTVAFRGDDFRARMNALKRAIDLDIGKPDSPFVKPERGDGAPPEALFADRDEKGVSGAYYEFTIEIKERFDSFGPSARLGMVDPTRRRGAGYLASAEEVR